MLRLLFLCFALSLFTPLDSDAKEIKKILLFGDSIIAGYGLNAKDSIPAQLEKKLKTRHPDIVVINAGISGDTTAGGRARLAWTIEKHQPDLILIHLGGNDMLRGVPVSTSKENLRAMLLTTQANNIKTILSKTVAPANYGTAYQTSLAQSYQELGQANHVTVIPFLLQYTYGNNALMQKDGIHPNAQGAEKIAAVLAEYFSKLIIFHKELP